MKKFLSTIAVVFAFVASVQAQGVLKFNKEVHDFGKVVIVVVHFINISFIISDTE